MVGLRIAAAAIKKERLERKEEERRREEEQKREEEEKLAREQNRRADFITGLMGDWNQSRSLRTFAKAIAEDAQPTGVIGSRKERHSTGSGLDV